MFKINSYDVNTNKVHVWLCSCSLRCAEKETAEGESKPEEEKETGGKREKPVVRPEEIPPVPENRFLLRRDMPTQEDKTEPLVIKIITEY